MSKKVSTPQRLPRLRGASKQAPTEPPLAPVDARVIHKLTEVIGSDRPFPELCTATCAVLAELTAATSCTLALLDAGSLRIAAAYERDGTGIVEVPMQAEHAVESGTTMRYEHGPNSLLCVPLRIGSSTLGAIVVRRTAPPLFATADALFLETCSLYVAAGIRSVLDTASRAQLVALSSTDALTGVANRRRFDETLAQEWQRCGRRRVPLSLLMLDVDYFKAFNDRYGHLGGDACLQQIAHACADRLMRPGDLFARFGGEEFVALLPETDLQGAIAVGEALCRAVDALSIPHEGSQLGKVSLSVGAAMLTPTATTQPRDLIEASDKALYAAKHGGRNRVAAAGYLGTGAPVVPVRSVPASTLPVHLLAFYGREREQREVVQRLDEARLVTLVGPGGVGKTRLAIEVGRPRTSREPVWFVNLAAVTDRGAVGDAVLAAMQAKATGAETPAEIAARLLGSDSALLILDNCEHVIATAAEMTEAMLQAAPRLRILATSRERLGIEGELSYRLPPLAMPPDAAELRPEEALRSDAVRLFVERAKFAQRDFVLDASNVATVVRICRKLDGIALALELAAPRLKILSLAKLETLLEDRLRVLTGGSRTALPRWQTLEALIAWSYDLLDPVERRVLCHLSVLVGSWPLDAAMAVDGELDALDMLDVLESLVEKSLLIAEPSGTETVYRFLETTRAYAQAKLKGAGEFEAAAQRSGQYHLELARTATQSRSDNCYDALRKAEDNVEATLAWALHGGGDVELGFALVETLCHPDEPAFADRGNGLRRWCEVVLNHPAATDPALRRHVGLRLAHQFHIRLYDFVRARALAEPLLAEAEAAGDARWARLARRMIGGCAINSGDIVTARSMLERLLKDGGFESADERAAVYTTYSVVAAYDNLQLALEYGARALAVPGTSKPTREHVLANHLYCLCIADEVDQALRFLEEEPAEDDNSGLSWPRLEHAVARGYCLLRRGNLEAARRCLQAALGMIAKGSAWREKEAELLDHFVAFALVCGEFELGARLAGHAKQYYAANPIRYAAYQKWHDDLHRALLERLGPQAYEHERAIGATMSFKEATGVALSL